MAKKKAAKKKVAKKKVAKKKAVKKKSKAPAKKSTAKKKATTKKKRGRPKQKFFEGMEPVTIPEIETAAEAYQEAKEARVKATAAETATRNALTDAMKNHDMNRYLGASGLTVRFEQEVTKEKVKVERIDLDAA